MLDVDFGDSSLALCTILKKEVEK